MKNAALKPSASAVTAAHACGDGTSECEKMGLDECAKSYVTAPEFLFPAREFAFLIWKLVKLPGIGEHEV